MLTSFIEAAQEAKRHPQFARFTPSLEEQILRWDTEKYSHAVLWDADVSNGCGQAFVGASTRFKVSNEI